MIEEQEIHKCSSLNTIPGSIWDYAMAQGVVWYTTVLGPKLVSFSRFICVVMGRERRYVLSVVHFSKMAAVGRVEPGRSSLTWAAEVTWWCHLVPFPGRE